MCEKLRERQIKLIGFVKINKAIANHELHQLLNLSERTVLRELDELIKNNLLIRKGEKKKHFTN